MVLPTEIELEHIKIKALISSLREGIIITDFQKNIKEFNHAAEELTGYSRGEVFGRPVGDFIKFFDADKELSHEVYAPVSVIEMDGVVFSKDQINLISRTNELTVVNVQTFRIKGGSQIDLGCIIKLDNVGAESELERMKLDFVSMSVHTLRTPVTILRGFLSQLQYPETWAKLNEDEREKVISAITGGTQLRDLIEKILSMSELQQGGGFGKFTPLDLDGLVQLVFKEFKDKAAEKGLYLRYIPPMNQLPKVKGDISKIEEVLKRLIDNGINFTDRGGVEIKVKPSLNQDQLQVDIIDTGRGIPEKNLPHVFNKFYRIKTALEMEQGTGISLYICKKIIDNHKGIIGVNSLEGNGSTFYFTLPIAK